MFCPSVLPRSNTQQQVGYEQYVLCLIFQLFSLNYYDNFVVFVFVFIFIIAVDIDDFDDKAVVVVVAVFVTLLSLRFMQT